MTEKEAKVLAIKELEVKTFLTNYIDLFEKDDCVIFIQNCFGKEYLDDDSIERIYHEIVD